MKKSFLGTRFVVLAVFTFFTTVSCLEQKEKPKDSPSVGSPDGSNGGTPTDLFVESAEDTKADIEVGVGGVSSGQTVTLFSDSSCQTQIDQATASADSVIFNVTGLSQGTHHFYAKAGASSCSTATVSYTYLQCPSGYIRIPGNSERGTSPFCVMKFEAKNNSSVPTSEAAGTPWVNITALNAKAECQSLNTSGKTNYDLISNQEWMTIAEIIQSVSTNWLNGNVGSFMNYGHSNSEKTLLAVADESNHWDGVTLGSNPTTNHDYRRTHDLNDGSLIWDFAGNAGEIVDYNNESNYTSPPACASGGTSFYPPKSARDNNHCPNINPIQYMPSTENYSPSSQYIGTFAGFTGSSRALTRGGAYGFTTNAGVTAFHISTQDTSTDLGVKVGFRCVYRLNPTRKITSTWAKDFDNTPDISVSGVNYGYRVKLYSDATCSTEIASKIATGTSVTLTTSALAAGSHNIYFTVADRNNKTSPCSISKLNYEVISCPTDYLKISGNSSKGVSPFCVMTYEARNSAGQNPSEWPNTYYGVQNAKESCLNLGSKYNLISNAEWMVIADQIASVAQNWSGGAVGSGSINRGNSNGEKSVLKILDTADEWNLVTSGYASTTEFSYRRTHYLPTGEKIWDFSGNAEEVVDYGTGTTAASAQLGPACTIGDGSTDYELSSVASNNQCPGLASSQYRPSTTSYTNSTHNIGVFIPLQSNAVLIRGGHNSMETNAGIYTLKMYSGTVLTSMSSDVGYRCVYRP